MAFATLKSGQEISGLRAQGKYTGAQGQAVGAKFEHVRSGMPVYVLELETVPQAFFWWKTYCDSDEGLPHSLEHLLVGKGTQGRLSELLTSMRLGSHSAATATDETYYHFYSSPGLDGFFEQFHQMLTATLKPDFSDLEAEREFFHVAAEADPEGKLRLIEKGTVYNEMQSNPGLHDYWYGALKQVLGKEHPLTFTAGGIPKAMRGVTPARIREYHRRYYALGPDAGVVVVVPPQKDLTPLLTQLGKELDAFAPAEKRTRVELPKPDPSSSREVRFYPYPAKSDTDPGNIVLAWKALPESSRATRMLYELLLDAVADSSKSHLYAVLVDRKTRVFDSGVTSVGHSTEADHDRKRPIHVISLGGIPGNQIDEKLVEKLRQIVRGELNKVAEFPAGSQALTNLNRIVAAALKAWKRDIQIFIASPPGFGFRSTGAGWQRFLEATDESGEFERSLNLVQEWKEIDAFLARPGNIWKELLVKGGLLEEPYASVGVPSSRALSDAEKDKARRLEARAAELDLKEYALSEAKKSDSLLELERSVPRPKFADHPPLSRDEQARVRKFTVAGVPAMGVTFDGAPLQTFGLLFSLKGLPKRFYPYLPLLSGALRSVGLREGETVTDYRRLAEEIQRDVYSFSTSLESSPWTRRYELSVQGQGTDADEAGKALEFARRVLLFSDFEPANLGRFRDLITARIGFDDDYTKQWEENWIRNPAAAFRWQQSPLYLVTSSRFTQAHFYHRLHWRLHEPADAQARRALKASLKSWSSLWKGKNREEAAQVLEAGLREKGLSQLQIEVLKFLRARLGWFPEESPGADLEAMGEEILEDLELGPEAALSELRALRSWLLGPGRLRVELHSRPEQFAALKKSVAATVTELKKANQKAQRASNGGGPAKEQPWVFSRLQGRYPGAKPGYPVYAGLVHPASTNGNAVITAYGKDLTHADRKAALEFLSSELLAGPGPHSLFIKTWEAGLAYSNGISADRDRGVVSYYADRSPNLRSTLEFVAGQADRIPQLDDPWLVDYSLAQAFKISRGTLGFAERADAMMEDVIDGITPEKVTRYSKALLKLRKETDLLKSLVLQGSTRIQSVLLGRGNRELKQSFKSQFFLIAPEAQLAELDSRLKKPDRLLRLWPRDFWIDP